MTNLLNTTSAKANGPRPDYLPEKFWDAASNSPRLQELVRSYLELERRYGQEGGKMPGVPASHEEYSITEKHPMCGCDLEVNKRLHAAGFTNDQAQLVYDLAVERLMPTVEGMAGELHRGQHEGRLHQHFGGPERWEEVKRQLEAWGKANLSEEVLNALGSSAEGILALERMMRSGEPGLRMQGGHEDMPQNEEDLKKMVADPRYWRQRDPAYMARVTEAFKRAYPGKE
ncbi:MAG: hypothetical protein HQL45_08640 [Alphaproteobacteria bacterium]|nr:hypothetical protein [Alphaproteobacteria bacterium]